MMWQIYIIMAKVLYIIFAMWLGFQIINNKYMQSKIFTVGVTDFLHGLFIAIIGAVLTVVSTSLSAGSLTFDYKTIGTTAAIAGLSYVSKKFLSNNQGAILTPDSK